MTQFPETKAGRGTRRSRTRRALRAGGSATLIVAISFALIELGLQVASLFAEDRSGVWEPGAEVRVLCVGDSHTWGAGVSREQSYPAHLQNHLDELAPGRYSVLQRYQPDVVVLWAGVNNAWNRADAEESSEIRYAWLEGLVSHLRTYRLVRVWLHDRKLAHYVAEHRSERRWHQIATKASLGPRARFTVGYDGVVEPGWSATSHSSPSTRAPPASRSCW